MDEETLGDVGELPGRLEALLWIAVLELLGELEDEALLGRVGLHAFSFFRSH